MITIAITCIQPEQRDLLDRIMADWEVWIVRLKERMGEHYEPSHYAFAYWLVRYSGLVEAAK